MQIDVELNVLQRGIETIVSDKFAKVVCTSERREEYLARAIYVLGTALGKRLDSVEYPVNWQRFVKRKDCPRYMKQTAYLNVNVYYPKLPLPQEPYWITIDNEPNITDKGI